MIPVQHLQPGSHGPDLDRLLELSSGATVVGLGATARTTRELALLASRAVRTLLSQGGFTALLLEGDPQAGALLDEHVATGRHDAIDILAQARPFLRTREILDTIAWMRTLDDPPRVVHGPAIVSGPNLERDVADHIISWHRQTGDRIVWWGGAAHTAVGAARYLYEHFGVSGYRSVGLLFDHGDALAPIPPAGPELLEARLRDEPAETLFSELDAGHAERIRILGPTFDPDMSGQATLDAAYFTRSVRPMTPLEPRAR